MKAKPINLKDVIKIEISYEPKKLEMPNMGSIGIDRVHYTLLPDKKFREQSINSFKQ